MIRLLATLLLPAALAAASQLRADEANYFLVTYYPGPSWDESIVYEEQPGLKQHHDYWREKFLEDLVVMGGPVSDGIVRNTLSIMLLRTGSLEEAQRLTRQDPGVQRRLVNAEVIPWSVQMSSMRFVNRRPPPSVNSPDQSFSIRRVDPESRINLEDNP